MIEMALSVNIHLTYTIWIFSLESLLWILFKHFTSIFYGDGTILITSKHNVFDLSSKQLWTFTTNFVFVHCMWDVSKNQLLVFYERIGCACIADFALNYLLLLSGHCSVAYHRSLLVIFWISNRNFQSILNISEFRLGKCLPE